MESLLRSLVLAIGLIALLRQGRTCALVHRRKVLLGRTFFRPPLRRKAFRRWERAVVLMAFGGGLMGDWGMVLGLGSLVALPLCIELASAVRSVRVRDEMEAAGIVYFQAVRGLVHSGLGLPAALFHVAQVQPSAFARTLQKALNGFHAGEGLGDCLRRFDRRVPLRLMGTSLNALQLAYRQGIPVSPLLDRMVPLLERERESELRLRDSRRSALVQAGVALLVPWVVFGALWVFQPDLAGRFENGLSVAGVLGVELVGVVCLVQLSRFC